MRTALAVAVALAVGFVGTARAESSLRLPVPLRYGSIPASTLDDDGNRIGDAVLSVDRVDADHVRIRSETRVQDGAHTTATALLRVVDDGTALQIIRQESISVTADGSSLGTLLVDHEAGIAVCDGTDEQGNERRELPIRTPDRVVNVPFNLLFEILVKDTSQKLSFDLLLCRPSPRFMTFSARVNRILVNRGRHEQLIEVVYRPDLGLLSFVTDRFVPRLSFWFDPTTQDSWVAHRMPLYATGPEVLILNGDSAYADLDANP